MSEESGRQITEYKARKNIKQAGGGERIKCEQRRELAGLKDPN